MLQPLRGKILVQVLEDNKRTESGIILAIKEEIPHRGLVISMGAPYRDRKCKEFPWGFSINHIVHYKRQWDGRKDTHQILRRDQIFTIECDDKAYAISEYIIIKKCEESMSGKIFVPSHFETEVAKEISYGDVISVGKDDKLGLNVGDKIAYFRNEGLKVSIPLQEELWSLKPRAVIGRVV